MGMCRVSTATIMLGCVSVDLFETDMSEGYTNEFDFIHFSILILTGGVGITLVGH